MAGENQLQLEYDRAVTLLDGLNDIRFKLLALAPTLSGTAVGLLRAGGKLFGLVRPGYAFGVALVCRARGLGLSRRLGCAGRARIRGTSASSSGRRGASSCCSK
jgi:hypothetical protein